MKVGCMPFDAMKASTLECFFSASCLKDTAQRISNLPSNQWPSPLNDSGMTGFTPQSSIKDLISKQMIYGLVNRKNYTGYFTACAPLECSYTLVQYNSFMYVITLLIGLHGGLTVALRLVAPFLVKMGHRLHQYCKMRKQNRIHPHHSAKVTNVSASVVSVEAMETESIGSIKVTPKSIPSRLPILKLSVS